jgi:hypothetical protein
LSKFVGRRGEVGIAKETVRGTAVNPTFWVPRTTINFDDKTTTVVETQSMGKIAASDAEWVTQKFGEGNISNEYYDKGLGLILASLLGSMPSTSGGNPYTHTYTLSNSNQHQSLSILYQDPDYAAMFTNAVVDSVKIKVKAGGLVEWETSFKSKGSKDWTSQTASYTSLGNKYLHQDLVFKTAANVAGLGAATGISLKELDVTIKANAQHDSILGTVEPEDVLNQEFSVEGSLMLLKQDQSYRSLMLDGTYKSAEMTLTRGSGSLDVVFPRVSFSKWEQDRKINDIVDQKITFKAHYDAANALDIISTCVLINAQSSY